MRYLFQPLYDYIYTPFKDLLQPFQTKRRRCPVEPSISEAKRKGMTCVVTGRRF